MSCPIEEPFYVINGKSFCLIRSTWPAEYPTSYMFLLHPVTIVSENNLNALPTPLTAYHACNPVMYINLLIVLVFYESPYPQSRVKWAKTNIEHVSF